MGVASGALPSGSRPDSPVERVVEMSGGDEPCRSPSSGKGRAGRTRSCFSIPGPDPDRPILPLIVRGDSAGSRAAGGEEPLDSRVLSQIAEPSNGELRVRSSQLAHGE